MIRLSSSTLHFIGDSYSIDNLADILGVKNSVTLIFEADIDFLCPVAI